MVPASDRRPAALKLLTSAMALGLSLGACGNDYWELPEEYKSLEGRPVVSLGGRITKAAHDEFEKCGLDDEDISAAHAAGVGTHQTFDAAGNLLAETTVKEVAFGLFEITCRDVRRE